MIKIITMGLMKVEHDYRGLIGAGGSVIGV